MTPRLAVVGPGQMAGAIVRGLLAAKWTTAARIVAAHPRPAAAKAAQERLGVRCVTSAAKAVAGADIILLGVKPQVLPEVLAQLAGHVAPGQLVVSLAAGFSTARIEALLAGRIESRLASVPVVRAMPNLAATVGASATALCPGTHATPAHLAEARRIFEAVGTVEQVPEKLMDAVTGLSGTGPMYVFHLVEAMADAGVKVGLSRDVATRLAMQTVIGSAQLAQASHLHPAALKDQVTSPGGTAIAALHVLRREGFQAIVMDAVEAATKRSAELGQ
ncbi:MAG: pyrroline-5-carboxylate reductase [Thermoplasmata archaeon]|jgi:pyrroline-5-carboxylate reductase|nr:pyrroline-5-carboxylate reductase [Thermoplasmata archaeon]